MFNNSDESIILKLIGITMVLAGISLLILPDNCDYNPFTGFIVFAVGGVGLFVKSFFIDE